MSKQQEKQVETPAPVKMTAEQRKLSKRGKSSPRALKGLGLCETSPRSPRTRSRARTDRPAVKAGSITYAYTRTQCRSPTRSAAPSGCRRCNDLAANRCAREGLRSRGVVLKTRGGKARLRFGCWWVGMRRWWNMCWQRKIAPGRGWEVGVGPKKTRAVKVVTMALLMSPGLLR